MIVSFACKATACIWSGKMATQLPRDIQNRALRKLRQLDAATILDDLRYPPGNHLEALKGRRKGQYSIRINQQWRICFIWRLGDATDVEIVDYH